MGIGENVPTALGEESIEGRDGVGGTGHGAGVDGFHEARGSHEEGGVACTTGRGDDLSTTAVDGFSR